MIEENRKYHNRHLHLIFTSVLIFSLGIFVQNAFADTVTDTVSVGTFPTATAVNPNTNMIYVSNTQSGTISVIDGTTDTVVSTINLLTTPYGIAVNPTSNMIYVSENTAGQPNPKSTIQVIDGSTNQIIATITPKLYPYDLRVNPITDKIYVLENSGFRLSGPIGAIQVIDGTTNTVTTTINTEPLPDHGIALDSTKNMIYVYNMVIDGTTDTVTSKIPDLCSYGLAVDPSTNRLYSTCGGSVQVVDLSTNTVIATISSGAFGIDVNSATNKIYTTNPGDFNNYTSVAIIDGSTNTVIQNITVGNGPSGVAVNPITDKIYVTDQGSNMISVISGPTPITTPSAPTDLTAAGKITHIDLTWIAPSNNGGAPILGYAIQRSTDNGITWSTIVSDTNNTETTYTDSHLLPVRTYSYQVSAINLVGTSDSSNTVSIKPLSTPHLVSVSKNDEKHSK